MAFDWSDYLQHAKAVQAAANPSEAELRTAISRAYYAAYNLAKTNAPIALLPPALKAGSHKDVWQSFKQHENRKVKMIGSLGVQLQDRRVEADYDAKATVDLRKLQTAIKTADELIGLLTDCADLL